MQAPCCHEGVLLEQVLLKTLIDFDNFNPASLQSDLAGQTVKCRIGEVPTMGSSGKKLKAWKISLFDLHFLL